MLAATCISGWSAASSTTVKTVAGSVSGLANSDGTVIIFKGIPYAAPPVGRLRWRAPQPATPWPEVLKADHFGASCMQGPNTEFGPWTKEFLYVTPPSEDCLFLNVWTPKLAASSKLPVLVFIPGGAFTGGSGDVPVYDGEHLAGSGIVVVTINYRLGAFGFLALPGLSAESKRHTSGNYGLLDQIAALHWVKENIRGFGGDPSRVTIAGQSAGAMSVEDLMASPLSRKLFSAAIADSGIGGHGVPVRTLADAEKAGATFAAGKNARTIDALRALPAEDLVSKPGAFLQFTPIVDGWVLPDQPMDLTTEHGRDNDVPVMTGFQENDYKMGGPPAASAAQFQKQARQIYGAMADEFLKLYPANTDDEAKRSEAASGQDRMRAGLYLWASKRTETHNSPVFAYYFDRAIPWPAHPEFGAFHTGEIPYTFGNLDKLDRPWEPVDYRISKMMMIYWRNMAAFGNPNGRGVPNENPVPRWAPVDPTKPAVMRLGVTCEPIPPADPAKFDFWKRYFESPQSQNAPVF